MGRPTGGSQQTAPESPCFLGGWSGLLGDLLAIFPQHPRLLQVLVSIADENDSPVLNELWDAWVPANHPPVRAMVQVGLGKTCKVEMVVTAAVPEA